MCHPSFLQILNSDVYHIGRLCKVYVSMLSRIGKPQTFQHVGRGEVLILRQRPEQSERLLNNAAAMGISWAEKSEAGIGPGRGRELEMAGCSLLPKLQLE